MTASTWLEILVVFYFCASWVQNHTCTKGSYLVITLHSSCTGQNQRVMCKVKELWMNFSGNLLFFWAYLPGLFRVVTTSAHLLCLYYSLGQASLVRHFKGFSFESPMLTLPECMTCRLFFSLWSIFYLSCSRYDLFLYMLCLVSCFHFCGTLRTSLTWHFPEWVCLLLKSRPKSHFALLVLQLLCGFLKLALANRMMLLHWSQTSGYVSTIVGPWQFRSIFLNHIAEV